MCSHTCYRAVPAWSAVVERKEYDNFSTFFIDKLLWFSSTQLRIDIEDLSRSIDSAVAMGWSSVIIGSPRILATLEQCANDHVCPTCDPKESTLSRVFLASALYFGHGGDREAVRGASTLLKEVCRCLHLTHLTHDGPVCDYRKRALDLRSSISKGWDHPFFGAPEEAMIIRWSSTRRAWIQAVVQIVQIRAGI